MIALYSDKVRQLITELPNRGTLTDATHTSSVKNPVCGDITHLYLRVADGIVDECRFQSFGCPAAIAASAAIALMCEGKTLHDLGKVTRETILEHLGGLPTHKLHGADLALDALRQAIGFDEV